MITQKRYYVLACEILFREICQAASQSPHVIDISFEKKALHDMGDAYMSKALQDRVNQINHSIYDAVLLGYGLCNNGIKHLHAPIPIVAPRAHDCITLLMGSKEKYAEYFAKNPGAYYQSSGWQERGIAESEAEGTIPQQLGMGKTYEEYAKEYGEENAEFLMSMLSDMTPHYKKMAFINNGIGDTTSIREIAKQRAQDQDWEFEEVEGNNKLIEQLVNGQWNEKDFLIIPLSHKITPSNDDSIIASIPL